MFDRSDAHPGSGDGARRRRLGLCDIDNFKRFNDTLGHLRGDDVIRNVAQTAVAALRDTDMVCR